MQGSNKALAGKDQAMTVIDQPDLVQLNDRYREDPSAAVQYGRLNGAQVKHSACRDHRIGQPRTKSLSSIKPP